MYRLLFFFVVSLFFISCKKENSKLDISASWQCNQLQSLDTIGIANKLIGSWKWSQKTCFDNANIILANKNTTIDFYLNRTFIVTENTNIITQGRWFMEPLDVNSWGLKLSNPSEYLYGRILFCNNQLLFNNSYLDGCDHLFTK